MREANGESSDIQVCSCLYVSRGTFGIVMSFGKCQIGEESKGRMVRACRVVWGNR